MSTPPEIYNRYEGQMAKAILSMRDMILDVAQNTDGVGSIVETVKWGQPSFVTEMPKSGSTIRIDVVKDSNTEYALYFICNTHLVDRFREIYPDTFNYQGNRAILFALGEDVSNAELRHCIAMALTHHLKR